MDDRERTILTKVGKSEILAGLAEECNELAHAALKLRRVIDNTNPTPVTEKEAIEKLTEEAADVTLYLQLLNLDLGKITQIKVDKKDRWIERLSGQNTDEQKSDGAGWHKYHEESPNESGMYLVLFRESMNKDLLTPESCLYCNKGDILIVKENLDLVKAPRDGFYVTYGGSYIQVAPIYWAKYPNPPEGATYAYQNT